MRLRDILRQNNRLDIYVDANYGDDKNNGTENKPVKTLIRAEELIPVIVEAPVVVWTKMHAGTGYQAPRIAPRLLRGGNIYFIGVGENVALEDTATNGSSHMELSYTGMTVDEHRGKTIEILSGAAAGCRRTVRNNTGDTIVPVTHFKAPIAAGDEFRIFEPAVKIDNLPDDTIGGSVNGSWVSNCGTVDYYYNMTAENAKVFFINFEFCSTNYDPFFQCSNSSVVLLGIKFNGFGWCLANDSTIKAGLETFNMDTYWPSVASVVEDLGVSDQDDWLGWGVHASHTFMGEINGYYVGGPYVSIGGTHIVGGNLYGGFYAYSGDATVPFKIEDVLGAFAPTAIPIKIHNDVNHPEDYPAVFCRYNTRIQLYNVDIESEHDGIMCRDNSLITMSYVKINAQNIGMVTDKGGNIIINRAVPLDIHGDVADFSEDGGSTLHNISELVSGSAFIDLAHLSKIALYPL